MTLILRIENFDQLADGGPVQFEARARSFDIGREAHLDWTLPDPNRVISGRHCEVRYEKGGYWLFDVSRNGTFLNNSGARMKSPHKLEDGDRLQIGHYMISVAVQDPAYEDEVEAAVAATTAAADSIWDLGGAAPAPVDRRSFMPESRKNRAPDFSEQYLDLPDMRAAREPPPAAAPFGAAAGLPPLRPPPGSNDFAARQMPAAQSPFGGGTGQAPAPVGPQPAPRQLAPEESTPISPEGFVQPARVRPADPSLAVRSMVPPEAAAAPPPVQGSPTAFLRALAAGAGVAPATFEHRDPEDLGREIGEVLKIVLEQTAVLLKARAAAKVMTKSGNRTMVSAEGNNPLKFIPATSEIIEVMFSRRRPGYLDARASVLEAFSDLKSHEMATFAAMQKALAKLLEGLSPQSIESKLPSSAFSSKKARAWDVFVERWDARTDPSENGMLDVFLAYFAEAYDEAAKKR